MADSVEEATELAAQFSDSAIDYEAIADRIVRPGGPL
jgi:hypothetical protein